MKNIAIFCLIFLGHQELRGMYQYYEQYTYFGPEAHRRGQCLGPVRVHRFCRLGEGPHEAKLTDRSLVKALRRGKGRCFVLE